METRNTDLLILGGGSAGAGAALKAIEQSNGRFAITIVEKNASFGGTSTFSGVNCWEPGLGGPGCHASIADALRRIPLASGVGRTTKRASSDKPWGESKIETDGRYEATLRRSGIGPDDWRRFQFEADAMQNVLCKMIAGRSFVTVLFHTFFIELKMSRGNIEGAYVRDERTGEIIFLRARAYIDCTADIAAARNAGCKCRTGEEADAEYGEPSAPGQASRKTNGATLLFRIRPVEDPHVENIPAQFKTDDAAAWMKKTCLTADSCRRSIFTPTAKPMSTCFRPWKARNTCFLEKRTLILHARRAHGIIGTGCRKKKTSAVIP